jgi:diamine N-acetyltransferase
MSILEIDTIALRPLEPEDLSLLLAWENNPKFWTFSQQRIPYSAYLLKEFLKEADRSPYETGQLRLVISYEGKSVGLLDFFDFDVDHRRGAIGVLIGASQEQQKGIASKALKLFIDYLFPAFDLQQVYATVATSNTASLGLFDKVGFSKVGLHRQWYRESDRFIDAQFFQFLKEDL